MNRQELALLRKAFEPLWELLYECHHHEKPIKFNTTKKPMDKLINKVAADVKKGDKKGYKKDLKTLKKADKKFDKKIETCEHKSRKAKKK